MSGSLSCLVVRCVVRMGLSGILNGSATPATWGTHRFCNLLNLKSCDVENQISPSDVFAFCRYSSLPSSPLPRLECTWFQTLSSASLRVSTECPVPQIKRERSERQEVMSPEAFLLK